jgi:hypothetical protein
VNFNLMSPHRIRDGVAILITAVSTFVADKPIQYSLGLDLRPSKELVDQIIDLGILKISCPAVLVARWRKLTL